jgi:NTP pyrophosphatase (non-canonical NTP hydrolase)
MQEMMNDKNKREHISEELSDILFFLLRFSQLYEFDMENGLIDKIKKNETKYPLDKVKGKNQKYTEY